MCVVFVCVCVCIVYICVCVCVCVLCVCESNFHVVPMTWLNTSCRSQDAIQSIEQINDWTLCCTTTDLTCLSVVCFSLPACLPGHPAPGPVQAAAFLPSPTQLPNRHNSSQQSHDDTGAGAKSGCGRAENYTESGPYTRWRPHQSRYDNTFCVV